MTDAHEDEAADPDRDQDGATSPLLTPAIRARIPDLYVTENHADPLVHAKLFSPWSGWTWYITEFDEEDQIGFGLACGQEVRFGYFDLKTLERIRGPNGLRLERDRSFYPRPLSLVREDVDRARSNRAPGPAHS